MPSIVTNVDPQTGRLEMYSEAERRALQMYLAEQEFLRREERRYRREVRREDRRTIRALIGEGAAEIGVSRLAYLQLLREDDEAAEGAFQRAGAKRGIDPDRLREILEIILEFIKALMAIFGPFFLV